MASLENSDVKESCVAATRSHKARKFIYLENVKSILSKQKDMKQVMKFLIEAMNPSNHHTTCCVQSIMCHVLTSPTWKACVSRGLKLSWASVAMENIGLPAAKLNSYIKPIIFAMSAAVHCVDARAYGHCRRKDAEPSFLRLLMV